MRRVARPSGITIDVPDIYEEPDRATRSTSLQQEIDDFESIDNYRAVDDAVGQALESEDMAVVDTFEYEAEPSRRRAPLTRAPQEQVITVTLEPDSGETAVALVEQDGVYTWQYPREEPSRSTRTRAAGQEPRRLVFDIPLTDAAPVTGARSSIASGEELTGHVRGRVLKSITGVGLKVLERRVKEGLVAMRPGGAENWVHLDNPGDLDLPTGRDLRLLLFVHGTFSSTFGSFNALGSLKAGDALLGAMENEYDAVVGIDHRTLSVDPDENAIQLIGMLRAASERPITIDAVAYSRGGLVLRSLGAQLRGSGVPIRLDRAVFVGATNEGTALAEPENWHDFIDIYTNLVLGAARAVALIPNAAPTAAVVASVMQGISVAVKYLADRAVDPELVPGLAAMVPDGEFISDLGNRLAAQDRSDGPVNYAVLSDFEPGADSGGLANELPRKLLSRVADPVVDRLMKDRPNDLVVDTPSMTAITGSPEKEVRQTLNFTRNGVVYHTVYFTQIRLAESLGDWFELGDRAPVEIRGAGSREPQVFHQVEAEIVDGAAVAPERVTLAQPRADGRPRLKIEVVWDDIVEATGDIYAVGHYRGVLPQRAELALDKVVSDAGAGGGDLVLTRLTRSNALVGRLGEVSFFPWGGAGRRSRLVAICGMGDYATFGSRRLRTLYHSLAQSVTALPDERTICTVLIGSGEGAIPPHDAVRELLHGFADALRASGRGDKIKVLRIVARTRSKAVEINEVLHKLAEADSTPLELVLRRNIRPGRYGVITETSARSVLIRAAHQAGNPEAFEDVEPHIDEGYQKSIWRVTRDDGETEESPLRSQLRKLWDLHEGDIDRLAVITPQRAGTSEAVQRMTFVCRGDHYVVSAITDRATIPERRISVQPSLIDKAVAKMANPRRTDVAELSDVLHRLALPDDFRDLLSAGGSLVIEVDRQTAPIHWEMLASGIALDSVGLTSAVARQLRTQYSENISLSSGRKDRINVLVIGDPGDPDSGHNLPKARREARDVAAHLRALARERGIPIVVDEVIGAPNNAEPDVPPADRFDVLSRLMKGDIDLVHYAGHGDFDPEKPESTGWLFQDGMLTSGEIERVGVPPAVVFANACLTGQLSSRLSGRTSAEALEEARLLPSLADEFLNRGVQNYIGTAWEIDDAGAVEFAAAFYRAFFKPVNGAGNTNTIGKALLAARQRVRKWEEEGRRRRTLWPAYQHYGDPSFRFLYQEQASS